MSRTYDSNRNPSTNSLVANSVSSTRYLASSSLDFIVDPFGSLTPKSVSNWSHRSDEERSARPVFMVELVRLFVVASSELPAWDPPAAAGLVSRTEGETYSASRGLAFGSATVGCETAKAHRQQPEINLHVIMAIPSWLHVNIRAGLAPVKRSGLDWL